jgi:hypothetical protein
MSATAAPTVDYQALAKQTGAVGYQPPGAGKVDYNALARQAGAISQPTEQPDAFGAPPSSQSFAERHPTLAAGGRSIVKFLAGLGSGVDQRALQAAKGAALGTATEEGSGGVAPAVGGIERAEKAIQPQGTAQKLGFGTERAAEFFLPGGATERAGAATEEALANAPRAARSIATFLAKAGTEAGTTGAINAAQGGSFKTGAELGAAGPAVEEASPLLKTQAGKIYTRLIRPNKYESSFGRQVGERAASEGIVANTTKGLADKLEARAQQVGAKIQPYLERAKNAAVNVRDAITQPLDVAIQSALDGKHTGLAKRLADLREELTSEWGLVEGKIAKKGESAATATPAEAWKLRRQIDSRINWKRAASQLAGDPYALDANEALAAVRGSLNRAIGEAAPGVRQVMRRYSELRAGADAAARRALYLDKAPILQWRDLLATGLGAALERSAPGGIAVGTAYKLARSPAVQTRAAQALQNAPRTVRTIRNVALGGRNAGR